MRLGEYLPRCSFGYAKVQLKFERTKKKGEKLASFSLIIFLFSLRRLLPLAKEALFQ